MLYRSSVKLTRRSVELNELSVELAGLSSELNGTSGEVPRPSRKVANPAEPELRSLGARTPRALLAAPSRTAFCALCWHEPLEHSRAPVFSARARKTAPEAGALPFRFGIQAEKAVGTPGRFGVVPGKSQFLGTGRTSLRHEPWRDQAGSLKPWGDAPIPTN
jgi:hypothetical protein